MRSKLEADISRIHASFVEAVSQNRNISMDNAEKLANGEVHLGEDAVAENLADATVESIDDVLAEIEAVESMDERFASMKTAYLAKVQEMTELEAEMAQSDLELKEALTRIAELEAAEEVRETEATAAANEAAVDAAIDEGRIAPGLKAEILGDLNSGEMSLEAFNKMAGNILPGTVVPNEELELADGVAADANDPLAPANETERAMFSMFPSLRKKLG